MEDMDTDVFSGKQKPPVGETSSITSTGRKPKKKSALTKLAEKRRRSESGSEFGSTTSLQSNKVQTEGNISNNSKTSETTNKSGIKTTDKQESEGKSPVKGDNQIETEGKQQTKTQNNSQDTPKPAPRKTKVVPGNHDWDPPPPLDFDVDNDENVDDKAADNVDKKAPSDATIHRFRALKMANDPKGSMESLKNLPFVPKPPETPKSDRKVSRSTSKGEKRNREPYSSSEEPEIEIKSKKQSGSYVNLKSETLKYTMESKDDASRDAVQKKDANQTIDSEADLQEITKQYQKVVHSGEDGTELPSPRGTKLRALPPISSKNHPPPPSEDLTSRSMKTSYKTDPSYMLHRYTSYDSAKTMETMSQRSLSSSMAMYPISIQEARARSGEGGNKTATSSLIGAPELERYFPERKVQIWVGSWNMCDAKECKKSLQDFLLPETSDFVQDIYAIGTQENNVPKKEWEVLIQATLGPTHVLYHSSTHGSLHVAIFIRRDLIWFCSGPEDDQVSTRAVTMMKTKGAVGISFSFFGTSLLFVNCHFTSDDGKLKERISDYHKVITGMKLPKTLPSQNSQNSQVDVVSKFDCVFFFGDLNFRIDKGRYTVEELVSAIVEQEHPNFEDLLKGDELLNCIVKEQIFHGFQEGRINFKPTYKFDINKDVYDTSPKLRIPSYTDRVLFRAKKKNGISCLHYDAVSNLRISDHRPVYGLYEALIKPGGDNVQLAGGHFDRDVYMEANRRWEKSDIHRNEKSSGVCTVQ